MAESNQTSINIPQLLAVALVGFFAIRWFLNKPAQPPAGASGSSRGPGRAIDIEKVDQISAMFPQLERRSIAWDLQRNGGSVSATTERVLSGRTLDTPPPTFQPSLPSPVTATPATSTATGVKKNPPPTQPDLIARYNLQSRVGGKGKEPVPSEEQQRSGTAWSADKVARAEGLKRRREEMVLAARRKMEAKGESL